MEDGIQKCFVFSRNQCKIVSNLVIICYKFTLLFYIFFLGQGEGRPESISRFAARAPLFKASGRRSSIRRSELYQKVCSNRGARMEEARAGGKSDRAGTHCLADLPI